MKQPNEAKERKPFVFAVIGKPGAGKSHLAAQLIANEQARGGKALLLNTDYQDWTDIPHMHGFLPSSFEYEKSCRRIISPTADQWEMICQHFKNGLLVADECKAYIPDRINSLKPLQTLLQRRRHYSLDMAFLAHGVTQLPPGLMPFITHFVQFETSDSLDIRKTVLGAWYPLLKKGETAIKKELKKNQYYHIIHEL